MMKNSSQYRLFNDDSEQFEFEKYIKELKKRMQLGGLLIVSETIIKQGFFREVIEK